MNIRHIKIENFKTIKSMELDPKKVNILVGRNNTGKTSVLQAISFAFDDLILRKGIDQYPGFIINFDEDRGRIEVSFSSRNQRKKVVTFSNIEILDVNEYLKDQVQKTVANYNKKIKDSRRSVKGKEKSGNINDPVEVSVPDFISRNVDNSKLLTLSGESLKVKRGNQNHYEKIYSATFQDIVGDLAQKLIRAENKEYSARISDILNGNYPGLNIYDTLLKALSSIHVSDTGPIYIDNPTGMLRFWPGDDPRIIRVEKELEDVLKRENILPEIVRFGIDSLIVKGAKGDHTVPMSEMGEGFKALIGILYGTVINEEKQIVLLEEPEVHMHPGYLAELAKYLSDLSKNSDIQFFISTHSSDLIQCFLDSETIGKERADFLRSNMEIFRLEKTGNTNLIESLDYREAQTELEELKLDLRGI